MNFLIDPNLAYVLLVCGFVLAVLALFTPGTGLLEIGALFTLAVAGYGIATLPTNWWALVILVVGIVPFLFGLRRKRQWGFLALSLLLMIGGSIFLFRNAQGTPAVNPALAVLLSAAALGILWIIGRRGLEAARLRPSMDLGRLIGKTGEAHTDVFSEGSVYVGGEEWTARSEVLIPKGAAVRVIGREGLVLLVEAVPPKS
ncbi:membrane-bound serine protease [Longilinea arvoryzae]|uniref:Membrane-bound serine protease n=1 Tax=Longilinea arvoryzae TaxID=360412 RepID=A0A0S7BER0_9CHLR|nr:NfeD family protein [Longilinea arvoryzae]GAP13961.1 membrane-bound serine protease [Longilinea arvoryzae]